MLLDLILLGALLAFVLVGVFRGALASGTSLVSLLLAYGGGMLCAQHLSQAVAASLAISQLYAAAAAGSLGFVASFFAAGLLGSTLRGWDRERLAGGSRGGLDRAVGGFCGAVRGGLLVLSISWLMIWLDAARDLGVLVGLERLPQTEESRLANATRLVVAKSVGRALLDAGESPEPGARLLARLASDPGPAFKGLQELLADDAIAALQRDKLFWTLVENGASERALNRLSFYRISHVRELRVRLADLGIVSRRAASEVEAFRAEARAAFAELGPRLKALREDPELRRLADNPEIVGLLESGDSLALLNRPEIQRLIDRIAGY